jgi:hypothetical protein
MSDTEPTKDNPKDPLILRCIKALAAVDWKALALVLAALAGFGGAIWNRVDAIIEKAMASRTQQGVYELLAGRLDEVALRLDKLEKAHAIEAPAVGPPTPSPALRPPVAPEEHGALAPVVGETAVAVDVSEFKAARLPSFQQVQQAAVDDTMPAMLEAHGAPTTN